MWTAPASLLKKMFDLIDGDHDGEITEEEGVSLVGSETTPPAPRAHLEFVRNVVVRPRKLSGLRFANPL